MKKFFIYLLFLSLCFFSSEYVCYAQTFTATHIISATDCTAETTGKSHSICYEVDSQQFFQCVPSVGNCDTVGEWKAINTTGNAATATALASNPSDCSSNQFANTIAANGNLTCSAIADADVPNTITIDLAAAATALASNPTDCSANQFANTIAASGNLSCSAIADADVPNTITIDLASAATALASNPTDCSANQFATTIAASGNLTCAQPAFSDLSGSATDGQIPDTITASNYLPLSGGTLTGALLTDNLGIDFDDSDTNPSCGAGEYKIFADLSETKLKKCMNGSATDLDTTGGTPSFDTLTGGTNTTAAMVVGTGASLSASGSGTVTATALGADGVDALTEIAQSIKTAANDTSALVVGTAGSANELAKWDANGNLVDHNVIIGTLTDGKWCSYASSGTVLSCTQDAPAGSGDVTAVGNCASGDCFTGASGTTLASNTDIIIDLDEDNNGSESFQIRSGADATIAEIDELGGLTINQINLGSDEAIQFPTATIAEVGSDIQFSGADVEIIDDLDLIFGTSEDWKIQYDEGVDNQLLFITANTSAIATTDPMFEILVGTTPTADQQVFGVAKGTQATNTPLLTLDEDGDMEIPGTMTIGGALACVASGTCTGYQATVTAGRSLTFTGATLDNDVEVYTDEDGIYFEDPTASDDFKTIFVAPVALTIINISCESDQTVNFDLQVDDGSATGVNGSDIACTTFATDSSLAGDTTMAAGDRLDLAVTSVSGTPTWVAIHWEYTYDD